jgi:hypothetical protein
VTLELGKSVVGVPLIVVTRPDDKAERDAADADDTDASDDAEATDADDWAAATESNMVVSGRTGH